jgi:hypothetical protein
MVNTTGIPAGDHLPEAGITPRLNGFGAGRLLSAAQSPDFK